MADAKLESLKAKYQPVLTKLEQLHARLLNLHVQDAKLVLRAQAKTKSDSNQVWNEIKRVAPNYQADLAAEILFDQDDSATASAVPATAAPARPQARTYTVQKGDTLSAIAKHVYGEASAYHRIFEANRDQLANPDLIKPGQVLRLPD